MNGSPTTDWMRSLADHYARCRASSADARLLVVFDIDGTILDMRHMVRHVLAAYDRAHGTDLFCGLLADHVDVHENQVDRLLVTRALSSSVRRFQSNGIFAVALVVPSG